MSDYTIPKTVAIWGGGLIGLSSAAHFARKGIKSIIYDINDAQVARINEASFPPHFKKWVGFSLKELIDSGIIRATNNLSELSDASVKTHFVAVPTERNGEPWMTVIETVLQQITELKPDLCIIESTVTPGHTEALSRKHGIPLGVATRRDWFTADVHNLENCVRVYSGMNEHVSERMQVVLSVVCKNLIRATSPTVVEITKCLDNGIFHTVATYASQIAAAYSRDDVAESLKLAATHWRLGNHVYFPSVGTGGPCVPLANKYLISGAQNPEKLTIAADSVSYDSGSPAEIAAVIKKQLGAGDRVAVLGICYRGDIKVHIESPHVKFARELINLGVSVSVHDPYYTTEEINTIIPGAIPVKFPGELRDFKLVYVGANHKFYSDKIDMVLDFMKAGQSILDNQGIWELLARDAKKVGILYHRVGGANWITMDSETEKDTTVFKTKWFRIYTTPDKDSSKEPWYVLDRPDSVTIIPVTLSGKILLQNQYRPQIGRDSLEIPMGCIDPGEAVSDAAERELLEETGISSSILEEIGVYSPIPGLSTQTTHVFKAQVTDEQIADLCVSKLQLNEGISSYKFVDLKELGSLINSGEIIDGFTLAALSIWKFASGKDTRVEDD